MSDEDQIEGGIFHILMDQFEDEIDPEFYKTLVETNNNPPYAIRESLRIINPSVFANGREINTTFSDVVKFMIQHELEQIFSKIEVVKKLRNGKMIIEEDVLQALKYTNNDSECIYIEKI